MADMNFGSGAALLGDVGNINAAAQNRGVDISALQQVASQSPNYQPMPTAPGAVATSPAPQSPQGAAVPGAPMPTGTSEAELIIKALSERLKHNSEMEKSALPQVPKL